MSLPDNHRVTAVAEVVRGRRVLDVGAGICLLEPLVEEYVGVDVSFDLLAPGDQRALALAGHLPFADRSFDTITCVSVLQYVLDVEGALAEFARVVGPEGQIVILVPNLAFIRHRLTLLRGRLAWASPLDSWRSGTIRQFTLRDLRPMLDRLRLHVHDVRCSGTLRSVRRMRPELLGADLLLDLEYRP